MNKNTLMKTIILICAVILIAAVALGVNTIIGFAGYQYDHADKYTAGETEFSKPVRNLDIDWVSGAVNIDYHRGESIVISETSDRQISADMQVRWWLDGDTLRIRFAKKGFRLTSLFSTQKKELTLTLPEGITFENADISTTSGTLNIPDIHADQLSLSVTSGEILADAEAEKIGLSATSGSMKLKSRLNDGEILAKATSGNILIEAENASRISADATSGNITVQAKAVDDLDVDITSGAIDIITEETGKAVIGCTSGLISFRSAAVKELKIDSTSGDVRVALPEDAGFTASLDTSSGKISYDLPLSRQGDDYICGNGEGKVEIDTSSGDIKITVLAE